MILRSWSPRTTEEMPAIGTTRRTILLVSHIDYDFLLLLQHRVTHQTHNDSALEEILNLWRPPGESRLEGFSKQSCGSIALRSSQGHFCYIKVGWVSKWHDFWPLCDARRIDAS